MDKDIYYEKILNRIIQGRLRIRLGDLVLFIYEPSPEILEESYDIYEDAYEKAYFSGSYVKQEILELLIDNLVIVSAPGSGIIFLIPLIA